MIHQRPLNEAERDQAVLYALGLLEALEAQTYEEHLARCDACRNEARSLESAGSALGWTAPPAEPSPELKHRLISRLRSEDQTGAQPRAQPWKVWPAEVPTGSVIRAGQGKWEPTAFPGVETQRLFVDAPAGRVTMLIRMAAGSSYPAHVHGGVEECYVLEGDLNVGPELRMKAGDYQAVPEGSRHPVQSTDEGCLLLVVSSLSDRLTPGS
jgi:anti-sigma factor ChrR (cupin superfamily)